VAPVPSVGQVGIGARGTPLEVTEQLATEVILLSMMGQTEPVEAPPTQVEVAVAVIGGP